MEALLTFTIAAAAAWLGVHAIRRWAMRRLLFDVPNHRSLHKAPLPTGGGLAIVGVFAAGLLVSQLFAGEWPPAIVGTFAGGALLIAVVSWIDDMRPLPIAVRLFVQIVAAASLLCVCSAGPGGIALPAVGVVEPGWLGLAVGFFWLLGMTNAYNFMDGVDGMAAGTAVIAGLGWFVLGTFCGVSLVATLGLLLAAASGGFLLHNRPPARIFMGDVGSAFLGFTFASMVLIVAASDGGKGIGPRLAAAGTLLLWPFVFDTLLTFARRIAAGENVFAAHREHLYQRLCLAGWSHGSVSMLYALMAALGALAATAMVLYPGPGDWAVVFGLPLLVAALWTFGRFQTTACDDPWKSVQQPVCQNRDPIDEYALERPWLVKVYSDDKADLHVDRRPVAQADRSKPAA